MRAKIKHKNDCFVERNLHGAHISGKGNCLVRSPVRFEAINCFYGGIGYMCERRGEVYK